MENFINTLKNNFKLGVLEPLFIDKKSDYTTISESYWAFLAFTNGTTIDNAAIKFDINNRMFEDVLCNFMSYEELLSNDYLEVKLDFFEEDSEIGKERDIEAWDNIKSLSDRYRVFCSGSQNSLFAFDINTKNLGEVYYLDLDNFPFMAYKIFKNFEEFVMNLKSI
jgi:hypothetical protein